jgi:hypothetical protein
LPQPQQQIDYLSVQHNSSAAATHHILHTAQVLVHTLLSKCKQYLAVTEGPGHSTLGVAK